MSSRTVLDESPMDAVRRLEITAARALRRDWILRGVMVLVLVTPLGGFGWLTQEMGFALPTLVGYAVFGVASIRLSSILAWQSGAFWFWIASFGVGTLVAIMTGIDDFGLIASIWQMMGLMALVSYACVSETGTYAILRALLHGLVLVFVLYVLFVLFEFETVESANRVRWVAGLQTNVAGFWGAVGIVLIVATQGRWSKWFGRYLALVGFPGGLCVMVLANSKGAWLTLAVGLLPIILPLRIPLLRQRRRSQGGLRNVTVLAGSLVILFLAMGPQRLGELTDRVAERFELALTTAGGTSLRVELVQVSLQLASENLTGYGIGSSPGLVGPRLAQVQTARLATHSEYLRIVVENGVIGLVLYLAGHAVLLIGAVGIAHRDRLTWPLAVLLALLAAFLSNDNGYDKLTWILLGLVAGTVTRMRTYPWSATSVDETGQGLT